MQKSKRKKNVNKLLDYILQITNLILSFTNLSNVHCYNPIFYHLIVKSDCIK